MICKECQGTGTVEQITYGNFGRGLEPIGEDIDCPECNGEGVIESEDEDDETVPQNPLRS